MASKILLLLCMLFAVACNSDKGFDCLKKTGEIIETEIVTDSFEIVVIHDNINLVLEQGMYQKTIIRTGENLLPKINFEVDKGVLTITNHNTCDWARGFSQPEVRIKGNLIKKVIHEGYGEIKSQGGITSTGLFIESTHGTGDIDIQINMVGLTVISSALSNIYVSGNVNNLHVGYYFNLGRFEGKDLIAKNVTIEHKGSNDLVLYPVNSLRGGIYENGDVVIHEIPAELEVEEKGRGKVIIY